METERTLENSGKHKERELKNVILTGHIKGKKFRGRHLVSYPMRLGEWMVAHVGGRMVKTQTLLSTTKQRMLWITSLEYIYFKS